MLSGAYLSVRMGRPWRISWGEIRLWDMETGEILKTLTGHIGSGATGLFSPNGQMLASGDSQAIHLWDVETGEILKTLSGGVWSVSFSPDGQTLASGSWAGTIHLRDVETSKILTFTGHTEGIGSVSFSRMGRHWQVAVGTIPFVCGMWRQAKL